MDLDHVALGLREVRPVLDALVGELGARVDHGGVSVGFRLVQVRLGAGDGGMKVELLEPWAVDRFDFLARFLDRRGEGPHHLTFKVHGIRDVLARLREAGLAPVQEDLTDPWWREAFLPPELGFGTVVQVAESFFDPSLLAPGQDPEEAEDGEWAERSWWLEPPAPAQPGVTLRRVVLAVSEVEPALGLFERLLGGERVAEDTGWVELAWPGGGRLRLEAHDDRAPGIERFDCVGDPAAERVIGGARFVVSPAG